MHLESGANESSRRTKKADVYNDAYSLYSPITCDPPDSHIQRPEIAVHYCFQLPQASLSRRDKQCSTIPKSWSIPQSESLVSLHPTTRPIVILTNESDHACWIYTGIYQGVPRNQRRQIRWQSRVDYNSALRDHKKMNQASCLVHDIEAGKDGYQIEKWKKLYGERLLVDPIQFVVVAYVSPLYMSRSDC